MLSNFNSVQNGDRIKIIAPCKQGIGHVAGDTAIVKQIGLKGVVVVWEKYTKFPDPRSTFVLHQEYEIIDRPRLTTGEIIAIVLLVLAVLVVFGANATGFYDYQ